MKKQITSFSPLQTGKVFAALYFVFSVPFVLMMALMIPFSKGTNPFSGLFLFALPVIYALFGFIFVALGLLFIILSQEELVALNILLMIKLSTTRGAN